MLHKNIPNNNKDIIRFLAKNFASTKKVRNTILFCSIVIGIVAITMVFGISFGKIQAEEIRLIRENGSRGISASNYAWTFALLTLISE